MLKRKEKQKKQEMQEMQETKEQPRFSYLVMTEDGHHFSADSEEEMDEIFERLKNPEPEEVRDAKLLEAIRKLDAELGITLP